MDKYDSIGIDLVAMSANDLATIGNMSPFLFIDYIAAEHKIEEEGKTGDIVKGIVNGLEQCDASSILRNSIRINFGKGETASVDELMSGIRPGYGFDIAGGMIGFVEKAKVNFSLKDGQSIVALPSSGLHSNGFTFARHILLNGDFETRSIFRKNYTGKFGLDSDFDGKTLGEVMLEPTEIYVRAMAKVTKDFEAVGVNNTGYGLKNFNRFPGKFEFRIDNPIEPSPIFRLLQKESRLSDKDMYSKFNMGMGFFIICNKEETEDVASIAKGQIVGEVKKAPKTRTVLRGKTAFEGY